MSYIIVAIVAAVLGGLVSYFALRNNPKVKDRLDSEANKRSW